MNEEDKIIPQKPQEKNGESLQKPIRTYESDVADIFAHKKSSVISMAVAENEKKIAEENVVENEKPKYSPKIIMVLLSILLIGTGIIGLYFLYLNSPLVSVKIQKPVIKISSIIPPDSQKIISIGNAEKKQLAQLLNNAFISQDLENDKIIEFIPAITIGSTTLRLTGSQFIDKMAFDISDVFKRSLTDKWMIGIYGVEDQKLPFIIFSTDFFQNAFAGMLKWESGMPDDLDYILNYKEKTLRGKFNDRVVRNRDVREFINDEGKLLFLYAFIDKDTIIIATSENTLAGLIDRIEKQTFVR